MEDETPFAESEVREDWSRDSALEAFKYIITQCLYLSRLDRDHPLLKDLTPKHYRNIANSLDLITTLWIPTEYRAGHVLAGFQAQENDVCRILSAMLKERRVRVVMDDRPYNLWHYIARAAAAAGHSARKKGDKDLANRYFTVCHTYQRGGDNL